MKLLISILTILALNGCSQTLKQCPEPVCIYPKLPTYKLPDSRPFYVVKRLDDNISIFKNEDIVELVKNNAKLRSICTNYAVINKRVNSEYQK